MSEYDSVGGGSLKLKGVGSSGVKKKKKDKEKRKILDQMMKSTGKDTSVKEQPTLEIKKTKAEMAFFKMKEKQQKQRVLEKATKTHKQRVEAFNRHLDGLTEHFDVPKVEDGVLFVPAMTTVTMKNDTTSVKVPGLDVGLSIRFQIKSLTNLPDVVNSNDEVYLVFNLLGYTYRTKPRRPMFTPVHIGEEFSIQKIFPPLEKLSDLKPLLEAEHCYIELVQRTGIGNGETILATFSNRMLNLLSPLPIKKNVDSVTEFDLRLEPDTTSEVNICPEVTVCIKSRLYEFEPRMGVSTRSIGVSDGRSRSLEKSDQRSTSRSRTRSTQRHFPPYLDDRYSSKDLFVRGVQPSIAFLNALRAYPDFDEQPYGRPPFVVRHVDPNMLSSYPPLPTRFVTRTLSYLGMDLLKTEPTGCPLEMRRQERSKEPKVFGRFTPYPEMLEGGVPLSASIAAPKVDYNPPKLSSISPKRNLRATQLLDGVTTPPNFRSTATYDSSKSQTDVSTPLNGKRRLESLGSLSGDRTSKHDLGYHPHHVIPRDKARCTVCKLYEDYFHREYCGHCNYHYPNIRILAEEKAGNDEPGKTQVDEGYTNRDEEYRRIPRRYTSTPEDETRQPYINGTNLMGTYIEDGDDPKGRKDSYNEEIAQQPSLAAVDYDSHDNMPLIDVPYFDGLHSTIFKEPKYFEASDLNDHRHLFDVHLQKYYRHLYHAAREKSFLGT